MRAVAVALVLIAGAAVVLWYGNTLNSWVLGGLIGGLAALLLSIPISLSLFSYLSRRHDERLRMEGRLVDEEVALAQAYEESRRPIRGGRKPAHYEIESSVYYPEELLEEEPERSPGRRLPAHSQQRLPEPGQTHQPRRALISDQGTHAPPPRPQTKDLTRTHNAPRTASLRAQYPGLPGQDAGSFRSKQQSEALRKARQEAAQQEVEEEVTQIPFPKKHPGRPTREITPEGNATRVPRRTRQLQSQQTPRRIERAVSADSEDDLAFEDERATTRGYQSEFDDDYLPPHAVQTEPISSETGPVTRRPHIDGSYLQRETDPTLAHRTKPLIRRAPYLYEDDAALKEEFSQYLDQPRVRRSSRLEEAHADEGDE